MPEYAHVRPGLQSEPSWSAQTCPFCNFNPEQALQNTVTCPFCNHDLIDTRATNASAGIGNKRTRHQNQRRRQTHAPPAPRPRQTHATNAGVDARRAHTGTRRTRRARTESPERATKPWRPHRQASWAFADSPTRCGNIPTASACWRRAARRPPTSGLRAANAAATAARRPPPDSARNCSRRSPG